MRVGITPGRSPSCFRLVSGSCLSRWQTAAPRKSQICSAARRSWGPSRSLPWLLGGSEDPWLSVPVFRRVWFYRHCLYRKYSCSPANCHDAQRFPLGVESRCKNQSATAPPRTSAYGQKQTLVLILCAIDGRPKSFS